MSDIALDPEIESGQWPSEFSGAWIDVSPDPISGDTVLSLRFNNDHEEGYVLVNTERSLDPPIPDAYVSWRQDGECREIFVHPNYRRRGIGTKLCAYARSYAYNNQNGLVFYAPEKMTDEAKMMYMHISEIYNEPFTDPEYFPRSIAYSYWGGYLV